MLHDERLNGINRFGHERHPLGQGFNAFELGRTIGFTAQGLHQSSCKLDGQSRLKHQHGYVGLRQRHGHFQAICSVRVNHDLIGRKNFLNGFQAIDMGALAA